MIADTNIGIGKLCGGDITNRVPADAAPDCEQRTRISRRAGEKAFANDMMSFMFDVGQRGLSERSEGG